MKPAPRELRALARRDPRLGRAMARVEPFPGFPARGHYQSHFHALASAIVYQQLAGKAARTIHDRVARLTPGSRFPNAEQVLGLRKAKLRGAGLSAAKTEAIRDLARKTSDGSVRLRALAGKDDEAVIEELVRIRGIGVWSAQMFLMFRLGRLDVMPAADLGIQEGLRRLDRLAERPKPAEVLERAEVWQPLRSVASWVLWRLT